MLFNKQQPSVYLVRHGHTHLNASESKDRIRAWLDVPLSDQGRKEAESAVPTLKNRGINEIQCSDLSRAQHTARILADGIGVQTVEPSMAWRPWNMGALSGQKVKDVLPMVEAFVRSPGDRVPGGESLNEFQDRYFGALENAMATVQREGRSIAVATHSSNVRAAKAALNGKDHFDADTFVTSGLDTGSVYRIYQKDDGSWKGEDL